MGVIDSANGNTQIKFIAFLIKYFECRSID